MSIIQKIQANQRSKQRILNLLIPSGTARPRWWVRAFINPFVHRRGRHSVIRRRVRLDVVPFRKFVVGSRTLIEDFSCINNQMGDVIIGENCSIGLSNTVIGPVTFGNNIILAQNICLSGLNHGYMDIHTPVRDQKCTTAQITVEDDCWIGANCVITAGVTIGRHAVVAAGSVVTGDVPPFSVVGGNPARVLRQYNSASGEWERPPQ